MATSPTVRLVAVDPVHVAYLYTMTLPASMGHPAHVDSWIVSPRPVGLN